MHNKPFLLHYFFWGCIHLEQEDKVATPSEDGQRSVRVLSYPGASGQCLRVRQAEQKPITSNVLVTPATQPRKKELLFSFGPSLSMVS